MPHYICPGECKGVSKEPGVCKAEDCLRSGMPLEGCSCQDNTHGKEDDAYLESEFER